MGDWTWRNNRRAKEFMLPIGRLTFYEESMMHLVATLADEHFAKVVLNIQAQGGVEGRVKGTNKEVEDFIAMHLLGMAVARRGNTLSLPPTSSNTPGEDFNKGLLKMCVEDCDCKIASKAFGKVDRRLQKWLDH